MKNVSVRLLLAAAAALLLANTARAEIKMGAIDLKRVFDGYFKTKQADTQLKESAADLDKLRKGMMDDYEKAKEDFEKLQQGASDQALSVEEREKRKANAQKKLVEVRQIEQDIAQFDRTSRANLSDKQRRMRDRILDQIKEVVANKAKEKGYNLVLDTAAESVNQTPIVLFQTGENDLTEAVLNDLNSRSGGDQPLDPKADDAKDAVKEAPKAGPNDRTEKKP